MDYNKIIGKKVSKILLEKKCIEFDFKKKFMLTSGKLSPIYCDCRKLISFTSERNKLINLAAKKLEANDLINSATNIMGGESAGIPYASLLAEKLKLPLTYVRKEKKKFGKKSQIEGIINISDKVILVEDLMTDGGSKRNFVKAIRNVGAKLSAILVIFNYGINKENLVLNGKKIRIISLATWEDVLEIIVEKKLFKIKDINEVIKFLKSIGVKNLKSYL